MPIRNANEISDKIKSLQKKRERNVDRYIIPIEMQIEKEIQKLKKILSTESTQRKNNNGG